LCIYIADNETGRKAVYGLLPGHCCNENDAVFLCADGRCGMQIGVVEKKVLQNNPPMTVDVALIKLVECIHQSVCNQVIINNIEVCLADGIVPDTVGMIVQKFRSGPPDTGYVFRKVSRNQSGEFADCMCVVHKDGEHIKFHDMGESGCLITAEPKAINNHQSVASAVAILVALQKTIVAGNVKFLSIAQAVPLNVLREDQRFNSVEITCPTLQQGEV
jgi:hypothetical protein